MTPVEVQIRTSAQTAALDAVKAKVREVGQEAGRTTAAGQQLTGRLTSGLGGVLSAISPVALSLAGLTTALLGGLTAGVAYNATLEQQSTAFRTLLGSAEAAQARMQQLADFAASTPFELPELVNASRILQSLAGDALGSGDGLRLIGDAAAATARPFEELAMWTGRLYAGLKSGTAVGEATLRLIEMGAISGDTARKLNALAESGAAVNRPFEVLRETFGRFEGAMALQGETFKGLASTLKDTIKGDLGIATASLTDQLKELMRVWLEAKGIIDSKPQVQRVQMQGQLNAFGQSLGSASGAAELLAVQQKITAERERTAKAAEAETAYLQALRPFASGGMGYRNYAELKAALDAAAAKIPEDRRLPQNVGAAAFNERQAMLTDQLAYVRELARLEAAASGDGARLEAEARARRAQPTGPTKAEAAAAADLREQTEQIRLQNAEREFRALPLEEKLARLRVEQSLLTERGHELDRLAVSNQLPRHELELKRVQLRRDQLVVTERTAEVEAALTKECDEQVEAAAKQADEDERSARAKREQAEQAKKVLQHLKEQQLALDLQLARSDWRKTSGQQREAQLGIGRAGVANGALSEGEFGLMQQQLGPDPESFTEQMEASLVRLQDSWGTTAQQIAATLTGTISTAIDTISQQISGLILGTQSWAQALANIGTSILNQVVNAIVRMFVTWVVNMTIMKLLQKLFATETNTQASQSAAAWAPAAVSASIASYGVAAGVGMGAYAAALIAGTALSAGMTGVGYRTGGYTGDGPTDQIAGVVHRRELVVPADVTARLSPMQRGAVVAGDFAKVGSGKSEAGSSGGSSDRPLNIHTYIDRTAWLAALRDDIEGIALDAMRRSAA